MSKIQVEQIEKLVKTGHHLISGIVTLKAQKQSIIQKFKNNETNSEILADEILKIRKNVAQQTSNLLLLNGEYQNQIRQFAENFSDLLDKNLKAESEELFTQVSENVKILQAQIGQNHANFEKFISQISETTQNHVENSSKNLADITIKITQENLGNEIQVGDLESLKSLQLENFSKLEQIHQESQKIHEQLDAESTNYASKFEQEMTSFLDEKSGKISQNIEHQTVSISEFLKNSVSQVETFQASLASNLGENQSKLLKINENSSSLLADFVTQQNLELKNYENLIVQKREENKKTYHENLDSLYDKYSQYEKELSEKRENFLNSETEKLKQLEQNLQEQVNQLQNELNQLYEKYSNDSMKMKEEKIKFNSELEDLARANHERYKEESNRLKEEISRRSTELDLLLSEFKQQQENERVEFRKRVDQLISENTDKVNKNVATLNNLTTGSFVA